MKPMRSIAALLYGYWLFVGPHPVHPMLATFSAQPNPIVRVTACIPNSFVAPPKCEQQAANTVAVAQRGDAKYTVIAAAACSVMACLIFVPSTTVNFV